MIHFTPAKTGVNTTSPISCSLSRCVRKQLDGISVVTSYRGGCWTRVLCTSLSPYLEESGVLPSVSFFHLCDLLHSFGIALLTCLACDEVFCWKTRSVNAVVGSSCTTHQLSEGISWAAPTLQRWAHSNHSYPWKVLQRRKLQGCYKEMAPSSIFPNRIKYSCLAQTILKINNLQWVCFEQYHSLKPLLPARTGTRGRPLQVFLPGTPPAKKH